MKSIATLASIVAVVELFVGLSAIVAHAQDPAKTDPSHFKVVLENDRVRVLHVTVEPNARIEVHELDGAVVVPLADYESMLKRGDGTTTTVERKHGVPAWVAGGGREIEAGARGADALLIEIKNPPPTK